MKAIDFGWFEPTVQKRLFLGFARHFLVSAFLCMDLRSWLVQQILQTSHWVFFFFKSFENQVSLPRFDIAGLKWEINTQTRHTKYRSKLCREDGWSQFCGSLRFRVLFKADELPWGGGTPLFGAEEYENDFWQKLWHLLRECRPDLPRKSSLWIRSRFLIPIVLIPAGCPMSPGPRRRLVPGVLWPRGTA